MKLENTISFRPDLLYLAPLLNTVLLAILFFLVNSSLVVRSGIRVDLPVAHSSLKPMERAQVVTVTSGRAVEGAEVWLNDEKVAIGDLRARLELGRKVSLYVVVNADAAAPHGVVTRVLNEVIAAGCQPAMGTRPPGL